MSKNLTRKGLAFGTILAFAATGITGIAPAVAAAGDVVSIAPTTGTGYGAYNSDYFNIDTTIDTDVVTSTSYSKLAIKLDNTSKVNLSVKLDDGLADVTYAGDACVYTLPATYSDSLGNSFTPSGGNSIVATIADAGTALASAADCTGATYGPAAAVFTLDFTSGHGSSSDFNSVVLDLVNVAGTSDVKLSLKAADDSTNNNSVAVTSFIDTDEDEAYSATGDKYPSKTESVTFYDPTNVTLTPRIERFSVATSGLLLNGKDDDLIGTSVQFSPALNVDQVDTANLVFQKYVGAANAAAAVFTKRNLTGNTSQSAGGRLTGEIAETNLVKGTAYAVDVQYTGVATTLSKTAGYTVPGQTDVANPITDISGISVSDTDNSDQTNSADTSIALRAGSKSFTFTAGTTTAATDAIANVPVYAVVTASDLAAGGSLTVNSTKLTEGQVALVSGVTTSKGEFAVNVTSALAVAGEDYTVDFYVLLEAGTYEHASAYTATYAAGAVATIATKSSILAGSTVTAEFTLVDQFGAAISANSSGTAYTVRVQGTDTTKLKKYAAFVNGAASVTFTNYLGKGQSDTITAALGTGLDATAFATVSASSVSSVTATLYNPEDAAGINVTSAIADKPITYDAFITGTADAVTNVAPAAADAFEYTGTVVDTTGVGIPGAVVTVAGAGLQFRKDSTGDYFKDSITVAADAAGAFDLQVWAHKVSSAGITITVTTSGKSATTKLTTTANGATHGTANVVTAEDLVFSWDAPKTVVAVDTTYIVTAKVSDKWGNPVAGANLDFSADGALQVNSLDSVSNKLTNDSGIVRVYIRSLEKTLGVGSVTATIDSVAIDGTTLDATLASSTTFEDVLTADLDVVAAVAPAASAAAAGSTGKFFASATNAAGKKVVVKVNGVFAKSFTGTAAKKVISVVAAKGTKTITIFVGGKLVKTQVVIVK